MISQYWVMSYIVVGIVHAGDVEGTGSTPICTCTPRVGGRAHACALRTSTMIYVA